MNEIINIVSEVLFPQNIYCIGCGSPIRKGSGDSLCENCREKLIYSQPQTCPRCGKFLRERKTGFCEVCAAHPPVYDRAAAAVVYENEARKIVHSMKYGGRSYMAKNMAYIIFGAIKTLGEYDIIVPVPMHRSKKKLRGFCQTTLMSKSLSQLSGKPLALDCLVRTRKTAVMSGLNSDERRKNVEAAFAVTDESVFEGKRVLLVDDVLTTGSTASECSRVLKEAGARAVYLAVFASPFREIN